LIRAQLPADATPHARGLLDNQGDQNPDDDEQTEVQNPDVQLADFGGELGHGEIS